MVQFAKFVKIWYPMPIKKGVLLMDKTRMLERAKYYSEQLLNGIEPNSGLKISNHDIIHTKRMKNYFQFVNEIINEIMNNNGLVELPSNEGCELTRPKMPFNLDEEAKRKVYISNKPVKPLVFVRRINREIDIDKMERFSTTTLNNWLVKNGLLDRHKELMPINKTVYDLNRKSRLLGIRDHEYTDTKTKQPKKIILFTKDAQEFILNNINEINKKETGHC